MRAMWAGVPHRLLRLQKLREAAATAKQALAAFSAGRSRERRTEVCVAVEIVVSRRMIILRIAKNAHHCGPKLAACAAHANIDRERFHYRWVGWQTKRFRARQHQDRTVISASSVFASGSGSAVSARRPLGVEPGVIFWML